MALTIGQRAAVGHAIRKCASGVFQEISVSKAEVDAAIASADDWIDANAASYNAALPTPFRTSATAAQKTLVLMAVAGASYLLDDPDAAQVFACIAGKLQEAVGG